jgi:hypothetical protein
MRGSKSTSSDGMTGRARVGDVYDLLVARTLDALGGEVEIDSDQFVSASNWQGFL